jgi:hypothetical protein
MRGKILLLTVAGAFVALMLFMFFILAENNAWNNKNWNELLFLTGAIAAVPYIGNSFPYFRKKDTTISNIMIPASVLEKFVYEYFVRVVLFTLFYPLFFYVTANLTVGIAHFIFPDKAIPSFSFDLLFLKSNRESYHLLFYYVTPAFYVLASSILIAGTVIVRRFPLIKTLVVVGLFTLSVIGYFYLISEMMGLTNGIKYYVQKYYSWMKAEESAIKTLLIFIIFTTITTLIYTYFKLKEKEV